MLSHLSAAWSYRHFIWTAIRGDFKARVVRSKIGTLWFVLHPLALALIYVLILSEVLGAKLGNIDKSGGYAVYLLAGICAWTLFSEIINRCITVFVDFSNTLKKISFPRICLPFIVMGGAVINQLLLLVATMVIIGFYGFPPTVNWVFLLPVIGLCVMMALGLGVVLGIMNVFARDVAQVMMVVMNMWFWLTPIVYTKDIVPDNMQRLLELNPMTPITAAYQDVILYARMPDWSTLVAPAGISVILFGVSLFIFRRASPELVDAL